MTYLQIYTLIIEISGILYYNDRVKSPNSVSNCNVFVLFVLRWQYVKYGKIADLKSTNFAVVGIRFLNLIITPTL